MRAFTHRPFQKELREIEALNRKIAYHQESIAYYNAKIKLLETTKSAVDFLGSIGEWPLAVIIFYSTLWLGTGRMHELPQS